jgi:hypothetical protein
MANSARVIADSHYERNGVWFRVVTMVIVLYRGVLAEFNTHRMLSRNSASSRAIPVRTMLRKLAHDLFVPTTFGTAIPKMNAGPALTGDDLDKAIAVWGDSARSQMWYALCLTTSPEYVAREWELWTSTDGHDEIIDFVLDVADRIDNKQHPIHQELLLNVTKGLTNRLLEPFMYQEIIVTATEWENFFNLRTDKNAQDEIRLVAQMMKDAYDNSTPVVLEEGEWHLPFIQDDEKEWAKANPALAVKASTARCARVSYLTHGTDRIDLNKDYTLADGLKGNGHMSPYEHPVRRWTEEEWLYVEDGIQALQASLHLPNVNPLFARHQQKSLEFAGNVHGFVQARLEIEGEDVFRPEQAEEPMPV